MREGEGIVKFLMECSKAAEQAKRKGLSFPGSTTYQMNSVLKLQKVGGGVDQWNPSLVHHLDEIPTVQFVGHVPGDAEENNLVLKVAPFEIFRCIG